MCSDNTDISVILDDLGYTATDLMNVNFVFIVEGKQDKNRLPILLKRYYSEIYDKDGNLSRIAIITTNSCTTQNVCKSKIYEPGLFERSVSDDTRR